MLEPTGPVWQSAKAERNWLIYKLIPRTGRQPQKIPYHNGWPDDRARAACMTFEEASAAVAAAGEGYGTGYLPRLGSAMVVVDLDKVLGEGLMWRLDALPDGPDAYITDESYTEVSPSGTGLHILLPREGWPEATIDNGVDPVGLHASSSQFIAITLDAVVDGPVAAAPQLQARILPELEERLAARQEARERAQATDGWFDALDAAGRVEAAQAALAALPASWPLERDHWRDVTFAMRGYPELHDAWDAWSRQGGSKYHAEENEQLWQGRERGADTIGIGSLLHWGQAHGADLDPWKRRAEGARAQTEVEGLAEHVRREMPGAAEAAVAEAEELRFKGPEELVEEGLRCVIRHEPSLRFMHLGAPRTLTSSKTQTITPATLGRMYPGMLREASEGSPAVTVAAEIERRCHCTLQGPIADPRVPFGAVYPTRIGAHDYVLVNKLRLRQLDVGASTDPEHWALGLWAQLLAQVFPVERERAWVERWVACKAQRPWERMVAVLSVTTKQGTGRGWFTDVLARLFGPENCQHVHVEDLGGATAQWNDYLLSLWVFVDEMSASEAAGRAGHGASKRRGYEMLKGVVDPRPGIVRRINVKFGDAYQMTSYSSFFIASNHEDGLPIPEGDRRFAVLQGNDDEGGPALAALASKLIGSEEAQAVIWSHLHRISLEDFNPAQALDTSSKAHMVDASRTDFDVELEGALEALDWPLLVTTVLLSRLAQRSEMGRAMARNHTLDGALKRWVQDNTRPMPWPEGTSEKGSRATRVDGVLMRVRVLRRGEARWRRKDVDGMSNEVAGKWLDALHSDIGQVDLEKATRCRSLGKGLRAV